ncbi:MAG: protein translocase subunit SecF [Legionellales bacterium]|nr:protein translocase subunit SecF [Legionellales bacterium]|tara:strand:+ start:454 stop:1380 length:927 start_codon:yes stop_codon:yes gene_type:complete
MELFKRQTKIDFMGLRKGVALLSVVLCIASFALLMTKGLNWGLDFTGGTLLEVRFSESVVDEQVRDTLIHAGFENAKVSYYGDAQDLLIRIGNQAGISEKELAQNVVDSLSSADFNLELRRAEFVGSEVGAELAEQGALAVLVAVLMTMVYIAFRFEYRFAVSAAVALMHDPIVILGVFSFFQIEFDLAALAAILAVMGYSLNDTIVVFDRVRENFRKIRQANAYEVLNLSINQTLSRTIMTSFLTLLVVVALFFLGGDSLYGFSTAMLVGIVFGTYSSIYVAGALALQLGLKQEDMLIKPTFVDDRP